MKSNKRLYVPLTLSLFFFVRKAVQYFLLGSYTPLLVMSLFLTLMIISIACNKKGFLLISKVWAVFIIIWSIVRILISVINHITDVFDEYHLISQFGILGMIISLIMLSLGVRILRSNKVL